MSPTELLKLDLPVRAHNVDDQLWDLALDLSRLNVRLRPALNIASDVQSDDLKPILQECLTVDHGFEYWEERTRRRIPFTTTASSTRSDLGIRYMFPSDSSGYTWIYCWGFRLLLADLVLCLVDQLPNDSTVDLQYFAHLRLSIDPKSPPGPASLRDHFSDARQTHAMNIIHASHIALTPTAGHYGAYRLSFGVLLALYAFHKSSDTAGLASASEIIRTLSEEKGLSFASVVSRTFQQMMRSVDKSTPLLQSMAGFGETLKTLPGTHKTMVFNQ